MAWLGIHIFQRLKMENISNPLTLNYFYGVGWFAYFNYPQTGVGMLCQQCGLSDLIRVTGCSYSLLIG